MQDKKQQREVHNERKREPIGIRNQPASRNTYYHFKHIPPAWLIASILYGLSWCMLLGCNLSFLAWFAFVPLFFDLAKRGSFKNFYMHALFFSVVAYIIICHGFLFTTKSPGLVMLAAFDELLMSSLSFAFFYPLKKRYGFERAIALFPCIVGLWEWLYQRFDHTYGYLMISHSQAQNIWLIQFIDIFGVWSISFWVMWFNVLLYILFKKQGKKFRTAAFRNQFAFTLAIMLLPPFCYSAYRISSLEEAKERQINITLLGSNFPNATCDSKTVTEKIDRLAYITDSVDYAFKQYGLKSDLYVWPEGSLEYGNDTVSRKMLDTAISDWKTPLLTGMEIVPEPTAGNDNRAVNRAALFTETRPNETSVSYYDKILLSPGHEMIPYHQLLAKIPFFPIPLNHTAFFRKGNQIKVIELQGNNRERILIGTPICIEQNYAEIWSGMALKGANCFVQLSSETWWQLRYFKEQMANISRLRCIETHRSAARCSNAGVNCFIDCYGRMYSTLDAPEGTVTAAISLSSSLTFFTSHQLFFPFLCIIMTMILVASMETMKPVSYNLFHMKGRPNGKENTQSDI